MGKKPFDPNKPFKKVQEDNGIAVAEFDPNKPFVKKKEDTINDQSSEGGGTGLLQENSSTASEPQSMPSEKNGKINPAVANAFEVSRRGKEYQQLVREKSKAITDKINAYRTKTIAELQPTIKTQEEADAANKKLNEDLHNIYQIEAQKAHEEMLPAKKAFLEAYNSPFKDKEYAQGFQETYNPKQSTQFPLTTPLVKGAQSAFTDLLPGQAAAAMAGFETANYNRFLVNKLSTFNPNDYWNPDLAYRKREKEVVDKYIKEVGLPQYEKEKKEFETERSKEKEKLLEYSARQEGEAAGKMSEYPASFKDIKDVPTALQYAGKNIGQTAGFMAPTIATSLVNPALGAAVGLTLNSAVEKGEAYKEGLGLIEENTGLSKKELFQTDVDKALRESTTRSGLINGLMEYASEVTAVGKLMPKNYLAASIANLMRNKKALGISVGTATEGITEWLQAKDTHYAAALGAGQTPEEARDYAMGQDDTEEFLAGITGGLGVSGIAHAVNPHSDRIDKTTEEIDKKFGKIETPNLDKQLNQKEHASKITGSAQVGEFTERPSSIGGSGSARVEPSLERPQIASEDNGKEGEKKEQKNQPIDATTNGVVGEEQGSVPTETANIGTVPIGLAQERTTETSNPEATDETGRTGQQVQGDEDNQGDQGNEGQKETLGVVGSGIKKELVPEGKTIPSEPTTHQEMLDNAKKEVDEGKVDPEEIVNEINESPRAIQPHEVAALVYYKGQLDNDFIKATKAVAESTTPEDKEAAELKLAVIDTKIEDYHTAALHTARQQSLAFGLRKMMVDSEYNLVTQVEKFKHENKGTIPDDILAKFKENDRQLKEANQRILELESKEKERLAIEQLKDIAKLERNKAAKGQRKAEKQRISNAFDKWKIKGPKANVATAVAIPGLNFAPDIWNGAVEAMKQTVLATYDITQALKAGIDYLKSKGQQVDEKAFESHFLPLMEKAVPPMESISGKVKVPQNMLLSMVESGVNSIEELTKRVHAVAQKSNPEITEREVRDAITDFGRARGISKNEVLSKLNSLKRIGRLISRIENLRENKPLLKNSKKQNSESEKEKSLKSELNKLLKANLEFQAEQLSKTKRNVEKSIAEYSRRIKESDFTSKEKKALTPDKELKELYQKKESAITAYEEAHEKNRLNNRKAAEIATDGFFSAFNAPKALLSSLDLSAPGRQGIYFLGHPKAFGTALVDMFKQLASQKNYDNYLATIKNSEYWPILNKSKLALTSTGGKLSAREELFMNRLTKWLPWVRISERAYSGFLNSLRLNVFMEGIAQLEKAGVHFDTNPEEYIRLAEHVNTGTGRSNLGTKGENASKLLNSIFFSPRFFASRLKIATTNNLLLADPNTYKDNARGKVNRMILLDQARFFGFTALLLGLLGKSVPDWEVEWNPLSSNFAKIKIGKNRYDITGGTAPILRYLMQIALGQHKVKERISDKSRLETLITGATHKDRTTGQEYHTSSLMRSKLSPTVGMLYNLADNQYDLSGQKMTMGSVLMNYFVPLIVNEAIQQGEIINKQNKSVEFHKSHGMKDEKRNYSEMVLPLAASTVGISSTPDR